MTELADRLARLSPTKRALVQKFLQKKASSAAPVSTTITRRPDLATFPLSFAQQRLWFLSQLEGPSETYNLPIALRLDGLLDSNALEQSLTEIVRRHQVLRSSFSQDNGVAVQMLAPLQAVRLQLTDVSAVPNEQGSAAIQDWLKTQACVPFDLACAPLMRVRLLRLSDTSHILLLVMHHIIADGWSLGIFVHEMGLLYRAFAAQQPSPLPELPIQYADFAYWQQRLLEHHALDGQCEYWKQQLAGAPSVLELPTDYSRPARQTFRGRTVSFAVDRQVSTRLKMLTRQANGTLFMTLLAAFVTLLARYSSQDDIVVGVPIANRNRKEVEPLIGFFVNTLVLRSQVADDPSFWELVTRVRQVALDAYANQDVPFEYLVETLQPERHLGRNPLFQVLFDWRNTPGADLELAGLTVAPLAIENPAAMFDLSLSMEEAEQGLRGEFEYSTELFEAGTIGRMVHHFQTLLAAIAADPDQVLSHLPLMTPAERQQVLVGWNDTQRAVQQPGGIHQLIEAQVERTPDAIAVVGGDQQLSYRELNRRANQLAHHLQTLGVGPEGLVGICVEPSLALAIGLLGILKAGGAYLPLDPTYPPERLAFMLQDAQASVLLTQEKLLSLVSDQTGPRVCLDTDWERIAQHSEQNPVSPVTDKNLAYVIYTSGSTGQPKGVLISHHGLVNHNTAAVRAYELTAQDRVLQFASFSFDVAAEEIFPTWLSGATLVLWPPGGAGGFVELDRLIQQESLTVLNLPSPYWHEWVLHLSAAQAKRSRATTLRLVVVGSDKVLLERLAVWQDLFGPHVKLYNAYGPTEATIGVTLYTSSADCPPKAVRSVPIGRPIANTQIYILDRHLQPIPVGMAGEVYIGGAGLAQGYLGRPQLSADTFVPHPWSDTPGARLYTTGDLARFLEDGTVEFLGRTDQQVKVRGFRVELGEIESALINHPAVREALVMVMAELQNQTDGRLSTNDDSAAPRCLVAYVVSEPDQPLNIDELRTFLTASLPGYMLPSAFVSLEALPLTANGKIDRRSLPAPELDQIEQTAGSGLLQTPTEELIAHIWTQVLGPEQLGVQDNFFALGGHSLLAMQVLSRVYDACGVELGVRSIFEFPTLAAFSRAVDKACRERSSVAGVPLSPLPRTGDLPLSFAQQRLWFQDQLEGEGAAYNVFAALRLRGRLDVSALENSLAEIIRRHEILRANFRLQNGEPVQVIRSVRPVHLPVVDLQTLAKEEQTAQVERLAAEEDRRPFDLAADPLVRMSLLRLEKEHHVLLVTMHHIVCDGWSIGIFTREMSSLYSAFSRGLPSPLPELAVQYADFAAWQRQMLSSQVLESQLTYWRERLAGAPPVLELPTDRPRGSGRSFSGAAFSFRLSQTVTEQLKELTRQEGTTLFMTLLAAFKTLLYRTTGQSDILIGTDIAGRQRTELEELMGFFINLLVLRTDLSGNPNFRELLARVRQGALEAYAHQDLPFEKLVEELRPERNVNHAPLVQALFVLQNVPAQSVELPGVTVTPLEIQNHTAKFDLALFMEEAGQGLVGTWNYNTDLFDSPSIARLSQHLETLLGSIVAQPDARLHILELRTEAEQTHATLSSSHKQEVKRKRLRGIKRRAISLSQQDVVHLAPLQPEALLPLVVQPAISNVDLEDWGSQNQDILARHLRHHGAILFRGFGADTIAKFERFAQAVCPDLLGNYGDLPREAEGQNVYSSTPYPSDQPILFHNESSHMHRWPQKQFFACLTAAREGGETPLVDCRKVYAALPADLRDQFRRKQLRYVRNFTSGLDVSWQDFFQTTEKAVVEEYCRQADMGYEWKEHDGLRIHRVCRAVTAHPQTGEHVFFNQLQLHHPACLDPAGRAALAALFPEEDFPRNVYYGDGSQIEDSVVHEILNIYQRLAVHFPWQAGDILMLDNLLTAHGRRPFVGPRKIVVAMGEMMFDKDVS